VLCIQTPFQLEAFQRLGNGFIGIDATHNVTQYQDFLLFTIIAHDLWGHGMLLTTEIGRGMLMPFTRRSCRVDAVIQCDNEHNHVLCQLGERSEPRCPA
jgi:hypothetical protein